MQAEDHSILDRASESLGRLRKERGDNIRQLRQQADEWARLLHSKGVSERNQVIEDDSKDRCCPAIRSSCAGRCRMKALVESGMIGPCRGFAEALPLHVEALSKHDRHILWQLCREAFVKFPIDDAGSLRRM